MDEELRRESLMDSISKQFYEAVINNQLDKILHLVEKDTLELNWTNPENGKTSLHAAAETSNVVVIALLIGKGADICIRDDTGRTPLNIALDSGNRDTINILANKAVASLHETNRKCTYYKNQLDKMPAWKNVEDLHKLIEYKKLYRSPSQSVVNVTGIKNQMDKIVEVYRPKTIFQCHTPRDSPITEMLSISHFQTIYNIFVSVFALSLVNTLLHNVYESGYILDFSILAWCFSGFQVAFVYWVVMCLCSFMVVILQKAILAKIISPRVALTIYILLQIYNLYATPDFISKNNFGTATRAALMCETIRLMMKTHSYMSVNRMLRIAKKNNDPDAMVAEYPANVTFYDYMRFFFFPTLIYQTSYPRTATVRYWFVAKCFGEVAMAILYIYAILIRYCYPHLNEMIGDYHQLLMVVFKVMLPGIGISLLAHYMLLHSWLNGWAEITRFADRHFYSDWWNATNWSSYYRKWNFIVHNFIHRHVFNELIFMRFPKSVAMVVTFIISAILHEYIIAVALGFYKPILLIMFLIPGVLFIYLTKHVGAHSIPWNIFMWTNLIIGHGMLVALYSRAYHLHNQNPEQFYGSFASMMWIV